MEEDLNIEDELIEEDAIDEEPVLETSDELDLTDLFPETDHETELEDIEELEDLPELIELDSSAEITAADLDEGCDEFLKTIADDDNIPWEPDFESLGKNISSLNTGLDLPSGVFSLAVNFFNIKSGLFLTYETDAEIFTPFSSLSIDETTLRRCRIHIDVLKEQNLIFGGTTIHPSISKDILKNYTSKRLWDTIDNLDIFIFSHHDRIFGLLIMFNLNINTNPQYNDFGAFFIRKCSELFFSSRAKVISSLPAAGNSVPLEHSEVAEKAVSRINEINDQSIETVKLVYINYSAIINSLLKNDKSIDKHRIEDDIVKMYNSMLFGSSFLIKIKNNRIFLCIATGLKSDNSIVQHQMSSSLISLFEASRNLTPPTVKVSDCNLEESDLNDEVNKFLDSNL